MARRNRGADGGYVYHVLNRAVGRSTLFAKPDDYAAFETILCQAWERLEMRQGGTPNKEMTVKCQLRGTPSGTPQGVRGQIKPHSTFRVCSPLPLSRQKPSFSK